MSTNVNKMHFDQNYPITQTKNVLHIKNIAMIMLQQNDFTFYSIMNKV